MTTSQTLSASATFSFSRPFAQLTASWLNLPLHIRRAISGGLIAGIVVLFFILIGIPGGAGETDTLPAWFSWALFITVTAAFAFASPPPRNSFERRTPKPIQMPVGRLIVGLIV